MKCYAIIFLLLVVPAIQCQSGNTPTTSVGPVDPTALDQEISADLIGPNGILKGLGLDATVNSLLSADIGPNGNLTSLLGGKYGSMIADVLRFFFAPNGFVAALVGPNGVLAGDSKLVAYLLNGILGLPNGIVPSLFGPNGVLGDHTQSRALLGGVLGGKSGGLGGLLGGILNTVLGLVKKLLGGLSLRSVEERGGGLLGGLLGGVLGLVHNLLGGLLGGGSGGNGSSGLLGGLLGGGSGGGLLANVLGLVKGLLGGVVGLLSHLLGGGKSGVSQGNMPSGQTGGSGLSDIIKELGGMGGGSNGGMSGGGGTSGGMSGTGGGINITEIMQYLRNYLGVNDGMNGGLSDLDAALCQLQMTSGQDLMTASQTCLNQVTSSNLMSMLSTEISGLTCTNGTATAGDNSASWVPSLTGTDETQYQSFLNCIMSPM